jgi:5-hydroxyisourate hydrolase
VSTLSTHVLDSATGRPADGMTVTLAVATGADRVGGPVWLLVGFGRTDPDGRLNQWGPGLTGAGNYRLTFDTADWFAARDRECFYPEVLITFTVKADDAHYHVPLLLAPFAYSTYRGS